MSKPNDQPPAYQNPPPTSPFHSGPAAPGNENPYAAPSPAHLDPRAFSPAPNNGGAGGYASPAPNGSTGPVGYYNQGFGAPGGGMMYQQQQQQQPPPMGGYYAQPMQGGYYQQGGPYQQGPYQGQYPGGYYPQQGGYYDERGYNDHRGEGICAAVMGSLACCCCLDLLLF